MGILPGDVIKEYGDTWDNMTKTQSNSPLELADGNDRNMPEPALLLLTGWGIIPPGDPHDMINLNPHCC